MIEAYVPKQRWNEPGERGDTKPKELFEKAKQSL